VALLLTKDVLAAQQVTIPEGTVIELRMETGLDSENSRERDFQSERPEIGLDRRQGRGS
jgi:hypothetical protein